VRNALPAQCLGSKGSAISRAEFCGDGTKGALALYRSGPRWAEKDFSKMKKYILPTAALAVCLGSTLAFAQTDTDKTTTTMSTPAGTEQTTTTTENSNDGYAQYRRTITTKKHYDAGAFMAPSGYTYSRYALGQRVNSELLGTNYVLSSYGDYALDAPPSGLVWIRVGSDALLVDQKSGEVVETDYGLFRS
jgi:Ni/Co efflux regulator RcnB